MKNAIQQQQLSGTFVFPFHFISLAASSQKINKCLGIVLSGSWVVHERVIWRSRQDRMPTVWFSSPRAVIYSFWLVNKFELNVLIGLINLNWTSIKLGRDNRSKGYLSSTLSRSVAKYGAFTNILIVSSTNSSAIQITEVAYSSQPTCEKCWNVVILEPT